MLAIHTWRKWRLITTKRAEGLRGRRTMRKEKVTVGLGRKAKRALLAAAEASHQSLSAFVLDSALARACEVLANRRTFVLGDDQWKAFITALDAPALPLPCMQRLLAKPGFFDAGRRGFLPGGSVRPLA